MLKKIYYGTTRGLSLTLSIITSILFCAILGIIIDILAYKPLRDAPKISVLITAIGVSFLLESLALIIFGAAPKVIKEEKYTNIFINYSQYKYIWFYNKLFVLFCNISFTNKHDFIKYFYKIH